MTIENFKVGKKWEYLTVEYHNAFSEYDPWKVVGIKDDCGDSHKDLREMMDHFGDRGWEAFHIDRREVYFKRELES